MEKGKIKSYGPVAIFLVFLYLLIFTNLPESSLPVIQWLRYQLDHLQTSWSTKDAMLVDLLESCIPVPGITAFHMH